MCYNGALLLDGNCELHLISGCLHSGGAERQLWGPSWTLPPYYQLDRETPSLYRPPFEFHCSSGSGKAFAITDVSYVSVLVSPGARAPSQSHKIKFYHVT